MFVDKVKITIKPGDGGDGAVSFRREKYVPNGGPDGGDGGNGGSVYFAADESMRTLLDFHYKRKYTAQNGENGRKRLMRGANGEDLIIKVPPGTVVYDAATGKAAADIKTAEPVRILRGGAGGRGNARFANATRQVPRFSTPGVRKKSRDIILELKSIADVGLIGFPNVGKSTLLHAMTAANPKIADYHFTTLKPNLGVVAGFGDQSFIMADIPGIISGAAEGAGLGHDFLRHIERTRMLLHVIDAASAEGRNPLDDYYAIREELFKYSEELAKKPEVVAANKSDIESFEENFRLLREELVLKGIPVFPISAASGEGLNELFSEVAEILLKTPVVGPVEEEGVIEEWAIEDEPEFAVQRIDGVFVVTGDVVDLIFSRTNPEDEQSMRHFQKLLIDYGIIGELRAKGAKDGDTVTLNGLEFEFLN